MILYACTAIFAVCVGMVVYGTWLGWENSR